ncbi:hypothetical protein O6H91_16G046900 [Diphasiastrum complanatum]|uniref:Uncharacterized protein n=1 Tax=Diphasiastrum complanatum TaxID=34168 RepID=A0ACC2BC05_DIPCM|nr:hypothetical protein O6H91_16G046900 [Diphasiastrum complanatum]
MSLACLACHVVESSNAPASTWRSYSVSSHSNDEGRCGVTVNCWSKKSSPSPSLSPEDNPNAAGNRQQIATVPSTNAPSSPRLTRCHAVRRDIFRDWNFDETTEENRQLFLNISGRA